MNKVVNILMKRDGYSREEAIEIVNDCREEMNEAIADGDYDLAEDILACDLGLEPDYIFDILWGENYDGCKQIWRLKSFC